MKRFLIIAIVLGLVALIPMCSTYNQAVEHEQGILTALNEVDNRVSNALTTVKGQDSQADAYDSQVQEIVGQLALQFQDNKAAGTFLMQAYPNLDPRLRDRVMQTMEIVFADMANAQTNVLDRVRTYETWHKKVPRKFFLGFMGLPSREYVNARPSDLILDADARAARQTRKIDINEVLE